MATRVVAHDDLPADAGLSAVGLLMRFGGGLAFWLGIYGVVLALTARGSIGIVGVLILGTARSAFHVRTGRAMLQGGPGHVRLAWIYAIVGLAHSLVLGLLVRDLPPGLSTVMPFVVGLSVAWPIVVIGILLRPATRAVAAANRRIFAEDLGLTGVGSLMTAMGAIGALVMAFWILVAVSSGIMKAGFFGVLLILLGVGFFMRSFLHFRGGLRLLRRFDVRQFRSDADQYFFVAVVTTVIACVLMLFAGAMKGGVVGLLMILPVAGIMLTWPSIVRDTGTVELRPDGEDEGPPIRLSRDQGLFTLGLVILTLGIFALVSLLFMATVLPTPPAGGAGLGNFMTLGQTTGWLGWVSTGAGLWAGLELVGMTSRRKIAVAVYLAATAVVTFGQIGLVMDMLDLQGGAARRLIGSQMVGLVLLQLALPLALPLVATVQAWRKPPQRAVEVEDVF